MFPTINAKETGSNLRKMMHDRGISAKEVQRYLNLGSVQSVYNWWNGINMPTLDNLYALSGWLQIPMDDMICGNIPIMKTEPVMIENPTIRRLYSYYKQLNRMIVA